MSDNSAAPDASGSDAGPLVMPKSSEFLDKNGQQKISVSVSGEGCVSATGFMPSKSYQGGSRFDIRHWTPANRSADDDIEPSRELMVSRAKDMTRNYEIAQSAVDQDVNAMVGSDYRLTPVPETSQLDGWDSKRTRELITNISALWRVDAKSQGNWFDPAGEKSFVQILALHSRIFRVYGESMGVFYYLPDRPSHGTAVGLIDPMRCKTPEKISEAKKKKTIAGIQRTTLGYPVGYYILNEHPSKTMFTNDEKYKFIRRRSITGRDQIIHSFIPKLAEQSRGVTPFASALKRLKKLEKYEDATINAAVLHATIAATIESDYHDSGTILGQNEKGQAVEMQADDYYMQQCGIYANENKFSWDDVIVPRLWNGEKLNLQSPGQPTQQFEVFERAMIKHFSRAMGQTFEWTSGDWSKTNYSGARAGLISIYSEINCNRMQAVDHLANAIYSNWLEDNISSGRLKIPGISDPTDAWVYFLDNKDLLTCAEWHGPAREEIDRSKQMDYYIKLDKLGCLTKRDLSNEVLNQDYREVMRQQVIEEIELSELRAEHADQLAQGSDSSDADSAEDSN